MAEYINKESAISIFNAKAEMEVCTPAQPYFAKAAKMIELLPAADVVSAAAYRQVAWERDLALQQLRGDYGVGLGEKKADVAPVVHGRWVEWYPPKHMILTGEEMLYRCSSCDAKYSDVEGYRFCPHCGAKMDLEV